MPLIFYSCKCGHKQSKFYRMPGKAPLELECTCGLTLKRQLSVPNAASVVTIDNGVMSKSLDVNLDVIKSNEENSTKDFSED